MATSPVKKNTKRSVSRVGSVKMSKKKGFSFKPWQALVAVLFVAVAGYAVVRFSQASTITKSFDFTAAQLSGGTLTQVGNESYRQLVLDQSGAAVQSTSSVTQAIMANTAEVCVSVKFLTNTSARASVWNVPLNFGGTGGLPSGPIPTYPANSVKDFCSSPRVHTDPSNQTVGITFGSTTDGNASGKVLVSRIYGVAKEVPGTSCKTNGTCPPPPSPTKIYSHGINQIEVTKADGSGGNIRQITTKSDGSSWLEVPQGYRADTELTGTELVGITQHCARIRVITKLTNLVSTFGANQRGGSTDLGPFEPGVHVVCSPGSTDMSGFPDVTKAGVGLQPEGGAIGVDTMYGVKVTK